MFHWIAKLSQRATMIIAKTRDTRLWRKNGLIGELFSQFSSSATWTVRDCWLTHGRGSILHNPTQPFDRQIPVTQFNVIITQHDVLLMRVTLFALPGCAWVTAVKSVSKSVCFFCAISLEIKNQMHRHEGNAIPAGRYVGYFFSYTAIGCRKKRIKYI